MRILPVMDLMGGQVVRGVAGRRHEYKPVFSLLTKATAPLDVALAFREHFGFDELYLADLDAIGGGSPAFVLYDNLQRQGFRLWVDAGVRSVPDAIPLQSLGVATIIAGLETCAGPEALSELLARIGPERLVFSLDLKGGQPLADAKAWPQSDPFGIGVHAVARGVSRMLVLDLAQVGVGQGVATDTLCRRLRECSPTLEIAAGGGVRDANDLQVMQCAGVDWLLVASALHDGRLTRDMIR